MNQILVDNEDVDLKDRAAFYLRVMQNNIEEFKTFATKPPTSVETFIEDEELIKEKGTYEFNTLSVIYNKPPTKFIKSLEYFINLRNKEMLADLKQTDQQEEEDKSGDTSPAKQQAAAAQQQDDLLDMAVHLAPSKFA
jgi:hypothetical protein